MCVFVCVRVSSILPFVGFIETSYRIYVRRILAGMDEEHPFVCVCIGHHRPRQGAQNSLQITVSHTRCEVIFDRCVSVFGWYTATGTAAPVRVANVAHV